MNDAAQVVGVHELPHRIEQRGHDVLAISGVGPQRQHPLTKDLVDART
jgi:hypothetical protein